MKKIFMLVTLLAMLCGFSAGVAAEDVVVVEEAVTAVAATAESAAVEAPAPVPDKGDTTWMMLSTLLGSHMFPN